MTARSHVYKILPRHAWDEACRRGMYEGSADDARDGFIHLSARHQLAGTLARHFKAQADLVIIRFETRELDMLRWEPSRGGELFPHLYAALPTGTADRVQPIALGDDGVHIVPEDV